ncbi:MAG: thiamine diphosphokinase [Candidatus Cryptobacteroides sp.]
MAVAAIICNGDFPKKEYPLYLLRTADRIVCCDGALRSYLRFCRKEAGGFRKPDAVIGDLDSLSQKLADEYQDIVVHIAEQETNDQTKAFHYVLEHFPEVDSIHILGATGKREAHTIGNLSLLMEYAKELKESGREDIRIDMISDRSTAFAVTDSCSLAVGEGRPVSIFSPDNSLKLKSKGLHWPTDNVVFDNWWKATLNRADTDTVELEFSHPSSVLVVLD